MRNLFRCLIALAYLASAQFAYAGFLLNPFAVATPFPAITFVDCTTFGSGSTNYTFTDHATGTASATRATLVGVTLEDNATVFNTSSLTVGGVGATELADTGGVGVETATAFYIIDNPTGTTATIVVNGSEATLNAVICVWGVTDLQSFTLTTPAVTASTTTGASMTLDIDTTAFGVIGAMCSNKVGTTAVWTGFTERSEGGTATGWSAADFTEDATISTPLAATCDHNGTSHGSAMAIALR